MVFDFAILAVLFNREYTHARIITLVGLWTRIKYHSNTGGKNIVEKNRESYLNTVNQTQCRKCGKIITQRHGQGKSVL